jgi:hypothetical protein
LKGSNKREEVLATGSGGKSLEWLKDFLQLP